ncbi:MAG TPA: hypothetical protein VFJ29_07935 [Candidatus Kapabacteria bacterium]|nr:hypothetical protein [Candidatus Kapabacteria bacterium]
MIRSIPPGVQKTIVTGFIAVIIALGLFLSSCKKNDSPTNSLGSSPTDVTMAPPPADSGFQIQLGPFPVPAGTEVQNNFYMKLPNFAPDFYVTRIDFIFNQGSHHLNVFKSDSVDIPDTVINTFNVDFTNWQMVCASQVDTLTWKLPAGCGIHLKGGQQMDFQSHYVNANTQQTATGRGLALINFWVTKTPPANLVGTVFSQNKKVFLLPYTEATYMKVVSAWPTDATLLLMTGHFHSRGKSFIVGHYSTAYWNEHQALIDTIYKNQTWDEPPVFQWSPGLVQRQGIDSLAYITGYENNSADTITFGGHVETQEHSNLFTFYYPAQAQGSAIYDFGGGEMIETHPLPH